MAMLERFITLQRINRAEHIAMDSVLFSMCIVGANLDYNTMMFSSLVFFMIIPVIIFLFMNRVCRLHDIGISGWWSLLMLVPVINLGLIAYGYITEGVNTDNNHGPKPHDVATYSYLYVFWLCAPITLAVQLAM